MGEWIKWTGGNCPIEHGEEIEVVYGAEKDRAVPGYSTLRWNWEFGGRGGNIIAYRFVKDEEDRREARRKRLIMSGADDEALRLSRDVVERLGAFDEGPAISAIQCAILDGMAWVSPRVGA